eukprot:gene812-biopygen7958
MYIQLAVGGGQMQIGKGKGIILRGVGRRGSLIQSSSVCVSCVATQGRLRSTTSVWHSVSGSADGGWRDVDATSPTPSTSVWVSHPAKQRMR